MGLFSDGSGDALSPAVVSEHTTPAEPVVADTGAELLRRVEDARGKVAKQKEHLVGAERALAEAEAALNGRVK